MRITAIVGFFACMIQSGAQGTSNCIADVCQDVAFNVFDRISSQVNHTLCEVAAPYINDESLLRTVPRASDGHVPVYLLPDEVIKNTGKEESQMRMKKSTYARKIVEESGYENLIIPTSCIDFEDYSVEEKLPISGALNNFFQYYQNPEFFTQAVEEFTGFLMQVKMTDLIGDRWGTAPRCDNVAPYLDYTESGIVGKLGLVDLEHLQIGVAPDPVQACKTAIHFFPYHFESILEVAKKFDPKIEDHYAHLESVKNKAIKNMFLVHFEYLIENQVTPENVNFIKPFTYTEERIERLKEKIQKRLELAQSSGRFHYLVDPNESPEVFHSEIRDPILFGEGEPLIRILESFREELVSKIEINIQESEKELSTMSIPDLVSLRAVKVRIEEEYEYKIASILAKGLPGSISVEKGSVQANILDSVARFILEESFNDWVEEGDISLVQNRQGYGYLFLV